MSKYIYSGFTILLVLFLSACDIAPSSTIAGPVIGDGTTVNAPDLTLSSVRKGALFLGRIDNLRYSCEGGDIANNSIGYTQWAPNVDPNLDRTGLFGCDPSLTPNARLSIGRNGDIELGFVEFKTYPNNQLALVSPSSLVSATAVVEANAKARNIAVLLMTLDENSSDDIISIENDVHDKIVTSGISVDVSVSQVQFDSALGQLVTYLIAEGALPGGSVVTSELDAYVKVRKAVDYIQAGFYSDSLAVRGASANNSSQWLGGSEVLVTRQGYVTGLTLLTINTSGAQNFFAVPLVSSVAAIDPGGELSNWALPAITPAHGSMTIDGRLLNGSLYRGSVVNTQDEPFIPTGHEHVPDDYGRWSTNTATGSLTLTKFEIQPDAIEFIQSDISSRGVGSDTRNLVTGLANTYSIPLTLGLRTFPDGLSDTLSLPTASESKFEDEGAVYGDEFPDVPLIIANDGNIYTDYDNDCSEVVRSGAGLFLDAPTSVNPNSREYLVGTVKQALRVDDELELSLLFAFLEQGMPALDDSAKPPGDQWPSSLFGIAAGLPLTSITTPSRLNSSYRVGRAANFIDANIIYNADTKVARSSFRLTDQQCNALGVDCSPSQILWFNDAFYHENRAAPLLAQLPGYIGQMSISPRVCPP